MPDSARTVAEVPADDLSDNAIGAARSCSVGDAEPVVVNTPRSRVVSHQSCESCLPLIRSATLFISNSGEVSTLEPNSRAKTRRISAALFVSYARLTTGRPIDATASPAEATGNRSQLSR